MTAQRERLKGSIAPLVTPIRNGAVDYNAYAELVEFGLLPTNEHRLPNVPATPELEKRLDNVLRRAGLLQEQAA